MLNKAELAWAAGFFDGEGTTCLTRYKPKNQQRSYTVIAVGISQVEREPLERFQRAVGDLGVIIGPYQPRERNRKPQYRFRASGFERSQAIVVMLWPYLCSIKQAQAALALQQMRGEIRSIGRPTEKYCSRGHDLGVAGYIRKDGTRNCRECEKLRSLAAYYRRKRDFAEADNVLRGIHQSRKSWRRKDRKHE